MSSTMACFGDRQSKAGALDLLRSGAEKSIIDEWHGHVGNPRAMVQNVNPRTILVGEREPHRNQSISRGVPNRIVDENGQEFSDCGFVPIYQSGIDDDPLKLNSVRLGQRDEIGQNRGDERDEIDRSMIGNGKSLRSYMDLLAGVAA